MKKRDLTAEEMAECAALKRIFESKKRKLGISQQSIADGLDITQGGVGHYLNGKNALNLRIASHFSNELLVPISEFSQRLADEQKSISGSISNHTQNYRTDPPEYGVPLISWVQAGEFCESPDLFQPGDAEDWLPKPRGTGAHVFALTVEGDSMTSPFPGQRSYPHGTIIYVDPDREPTNGARVVARANGSQTFKLYVEDAGKMYLKPINPTYDKIEIIDGTSICGVVIGSYLPE